MAIYKHGRRFEIQQMARAELDPGTAGLRVRRADHSATFPPREVSSVFTYVASIYAYLLEQKKAFT